MSESNGVKEPPRPVAQVVITLDERGGVAANHPPDLMLTLGMMEMAKLAITEQRVLAAARDSIAIASSLPRMR